MVKRANSNCGDIEILKADHEEMLKNKRVLKQSIKANIDKFFDEALKKSNDENHLRRIDDDRKKFLARLGCHYRDIVGPMVKSFEPIEHVDDSDAEDDAPVDAVVDLEDSDDESEHGSDDDGSLADFVVNDESDKESDNKPNTPWKQLCLAEMTDSDDDSDVSSLDVSVVANDEAAKDPKELSGKMRMPSYLAAMSDSDDSDDSAEEHTKPSGIKLSGKKRMPAYLTAMPDTDKSGTDEVVPATSSASDDTGTMKRRKLFRTCCRRMGR